MTAAPPLVLLAHHLKTLKLPTFLREYEKVAGECAREGADHPRYLLRLAELELLTPRRMTPARPCWPRSRPPRGKAVDVILAAKVRLCVEDA